MINPVDTLSLNPAIIKTWQENSDYDYSRELMPRKTNFTERLSELLNRIFSVDLGLGKFYADYGEVIWIVVAIIVILLIVLFIYKKHPEFFGFSRKTTVDYDVTEDTIYGVDFSNEIRKALASENYREAVRLIYLQTLKWLSDNGKIDWQIYKTPTQYTYEVKTQEFRMFTNNFLKIRFGNFNADRQLCEWMQNSQKNIERGGGQ